MRDWFENVPGVRGVRLGYTGGSLPNPTGVHVALGFTGVWQCVVLPKTVCTNDTHRPRHGSRGHV